MDTKIKRFIEDICHLLGIDPPEISYDTSSLATNTNQAQTLSDGSTIFIKKKKPDLDYLLAIAHELRHVWQIRTDYDKYFKDYKTIDLLDTESYNNQLAEIDANAFATIVMTDMFGISPQFYNLSETTKKMIKLRASKIAQDLAR